MSSFARDSCSFSVVCLYHILPAPIFVVSTSPQKGAMILYVCEYSAVADARGKDWGEYTDEGALNDRMPLVLICMEEIIYIHTKPPCLS